MSSQSSVIVNNAGEFVAGVTITYSDVPIAGGVKLVNKTNNRIYNLMTAISNLVYDSTKRPTQVTCNGADVTGYRGA